MILTSPTLKEQLSKSTLFLDTNVFSAATRNKEFLDFILDLHNCDCALATIDSVFFEVTRGSTDLKTFNERREVLNSIVDRIVPIDKWMNDIDVFSLLMARLQPDKSQYTDFLLAACLHKYQAGAFPTYLLTTDKKALPDSLFNRISVITLDSGKDIINFSLYQFSKTGFEKAAASLA